MHINDYFETKMQKERITITGDLDFLFVCVDVYHCDSKSQPRFRHFIKRVANVRTLQ